MATMDIHFGIGFCLTMTLVLAVSAGLQTAVGFGFNLLAVPILIFLYRDPMIVVPALVLAWFPAGVLLSVKNHQEIDYHRMRLWAVPAVPGVLLGVWMLASLNAQTIGRLIGGVTILTAVMIWLRITKPVKQEWPWLIGTGALSGVLAGSTGMSGPPVMLFGINQAWCTYRLRATLFMYFSILGAFTLVIMYFKGLLTQEVLVMALVGLPGMVCGYFAGVWLSRHLHGPRFRVVAIVLLIIAGSTPWLK